MEKECEEWRKGGHKLGKVRVRRFIWESGGKENGMVKMKSGSDEEECV